MSTYLLDAGLDTGPVLERWTLEPRGGESIGGFEARVTDLCARVVVSSAQKCLSGQLVRTAPEPPQHGALQHMLSLAATIRRYAKLRRNSRRQGKRTASPPDS